MKRSFLIVLGTALLIAGPSSAATIDWVRGKVFINHGTGYVPASEGTTANPGDMVMAGPKSSASVVYLGGSSVEVGPGGVYTVADRPPSQVMRLSPGDEPNFPRDMIPFAVGAAIIAGTFAIVTSNDDNAGRRFAAPSSP